MKGKFLIVDGNNLLHSSYHVAQKMSWQIPNGTIFFFLRVLISVLKKGNYQKLLVVFDGGGTNFRERIFSQYKAHRVGMPQELWEQLEALKKILEKTGIAYLQLINCEADDIIASFISQKQSMSFFDVFTRDKDLLQLISEEVNILKYIDSKITLYTQENFRQEYGFPPSSYIDYLSLLGDNVDNIKGIKGIGPVSAKNLIQQFGTVENIYQQIDNVPENSKKLLEGKEEIVYLNKKIISLEKNIVLPTDKIKNCDFAWEKWKKDEEFRRFCVDNKFLSILKLLD